MMGPDDLDAPLRGGPRADVPRRWSLARLALALLALAALPLILWVLLVDDPLGGEPVATASIERRLAGPQHAAPTTPEPQAMRGSVPIVGPGDPMPQSGPVIIRVPGSGGADSPRGTGPAEPIAALLEPSRFGPLPRIAPDGTRPSRRYARPAPASDGPRVALLIDGLDGAGAAAAIERLPAAATLAFSAALPDLERRLAEARGAGRETMLLVPLESYGAAPDPQTLLTGLPPEANLERLRRMLGRATGYVGLASAGGDRFSETGTALEPVLVEIARRGLVFVDAGTGPRSLVPKLSAEIGLAAARAETSVDALAEAGAIDGELARLEQMARERGRALGTASAAPLTLDRIAAWASGLSARGVTLVPASALALPHSAALAGAR
jgi:polysaccharide deacetylase 2 family uncharacterized protein YibQ